MSALRIPALGAPGTPGLAPMAVRRSSVIDAAVQRARQEIMAQEDAAVFAALDAVARPPLLCEGGGHASRGRPIEECPEDSCAVRHVQES